MFVIILKLKIIENESLTYLSIRKLFCNLKSKHKIKMKKINNFLLITIKCNIISSIFHKFEYIKIMASENALKISCHIHFGAKKHQIFNLTYPQSTAQGDEVFLSKKVKNYLDHFKMHCHIFCNRLWFIFDNFSLIVSKLFPWMFLKVLS